MQPLMQISREWERQVAVWFQNKRQRDKRPVTFDSSRSAISATLDSGDNDGDDDDDDEAPQPRPAKAARKLFGRHPAPFRPSKASLDDVYM